MSAPLYELTLLAREAQVDVLSDALMELEALSVAIEDADAGSGAEQAIFGEPGMEVPEGGWQRSFVKALFPGEDAALGAATLLLAQDWIGDTRVQSLAPVAEQDWVRLTQSQFSPVEITPAFWIVPSWHHPPAQAEKIIRLDPGLAFGTGTHPTTRMCLGWIARHAETMRKARVLDYGCGSGILAIGAALFEAGAIDAVDIDPAAVESTKANALANQVQLTAGLPDVASGRYGIVLANILATPLKLLAPLLCSHLGEHGQLVLAGILERQAAELQAAYAPWLDLSVSDHCDGWILMTGQARSV